MDDEEKDRRQGTQDGLGVGQQVAWFLLGFLLSLLGLLIAWLVTSSHPEPVRFEERRFAVCGVCFPILVLLVGWVVMTVANLLGMSL